MPRSTGDETFDAMLGGGVPEGRMLLLRGGPGAGARRLAAGFLRTGVAADEDCLYLTADATLAALEAETDAVLPAGATLAALEPTEDGVSVSIGGTETRSATTAEIPAAAPPETATETVTETETATETPTETERRPSADRGLPSAETGLPSTETDLPSVLSRLPAERYDRVVLDGVTGIADAAGGWRRVTALLSRFEAAEATCIVTADADASAASLARRAVGVVDCWQEAVEGDYQPFVRVRSLQGVDHDTRRHRLALDDESASVVARSRGPTHPRLATDIPTFDELTGGGFARGGTTVFAHENADHWPFTAALCARVVERGATVVCITAPGVVTGRLDDLLAVPVGGVRELMREDKLYLVDTVSQDYDMLAASGLPDENVLVESEIGSIQRSIQALVDELIGRPVLAVLDVTPMLHLVDDDQARQLLYWASANVLALEGLSLVLAVDPAVAGEELTAFFTGAAEQVFRTWRHSDGLQHLAVVKTPEGAPGHSRTVEPIDEPPYVRLR